MYNAKGKRHSEWMNEAVQAARNCTFNTWIRNGKPEYNELAEYEGEHNKAVNV